MKALLRINQLEGHRLAPVAVVNAPPGFAVDVHDLGIGNITDFVALGLRPACPRQVLKRGQRFIIGVLFPQGFADGGVGVIAEGMVLLRARRFGKPLAKHLVLGEFAGGCSALLAVGQRHLRVVQRFHQPLQPVGVNRVDVRAGDHHALRASLRHAQVE